MNLQQIIAEADLLVPNEVQVADKVLYLNSANQDFFNVVKIPKITFFNCVESQQDYSLPNDVRAKNIDLVMVGMFQYFNLERDLVTPAQNAYSFDDSTSKISIHPAPYADLQGVVRYRRVATTIFSASDLNKVPDAPEEYHWTFVSALASFIANTQDDVVKASNYENQYKAAWNVAAQNYQSE